MDFYYGGKILVSIWGVNDSELAGRTAAVERRGEVLTAGSGRFSGAEIEQVIVAGLSTAFAQKQQPITDVLLPELRSTQPLGVTRAEEVEGIREWAKTRAVSGD